jgi:hypothetical protein
MERRVSRRGAVLCLVAAWLAGCGKNGGGILSTSIPVSLDISEQTIPGYLPAALQATCNPAIPGVGNLGPDSILPITFDIKASQQLKGKDFIGFVHVSLDHVTLTIVPPSQTGQTWDFLDSIKLFAQAVGSTKPPVLVAELNPVPNGKTEIDIPGTGVDISDIASADKFQISGEVTGRPPCADVHFVGEADFDVSLK